MTTQINAWSGKESLSPLNVPARLHSEEVAKILGFMPHDVSILVSRGMLKPLGNPAQNAPKHFAAVQIYELALDREWLDKATRLISKYWKIKNCREHKEESKEKESSL